MLKRAIKLKVHFPRGRLHSNVGKMMLTFYLNIGWFQILSMAKIYLFALVSIHMLMSCLVTLTLLFQLLILASLHLQKTDTIEKLLRHFG